LRGYSSDWEVREFSTADDGDGTLEISYDHGFAPVNVEVLNAHYVSKISQYALSASGEVAFIEKASIYGITGLHSLDPSAASSFGLGGSASTDGGLGFLMGIGVKAIDIAGNEITPNLYGLNVLANLDTKSLPRDISWVFLADVENHLVGKNEVPYIF